jgi:hypothetical protein
VSFTAPIAALRTRLSTLVLLACAACAAGPALAAEVIEFHNANLDNYFITADRVEAAAIDGGAAGPGWSRTGFNFSAGGPTPVCRFYGSIAPGPNSHFYTALPDECAALKQLQAARRRHAEAVELREPRFHDGRRAAPCPAATTPVYRAYNDGFRAGSTATTGSRPASSRYSRWCIAAGATRAW